MAGKLRFLRRTSPKFSAPIYYNASVAVPERTMSEDQLYAAAEAAGGSFEFNEAVAGVFPDMLKRSVPAYAETIRTIGTLAGRFVVADSRCYDLGCSLGAATLAMRDNVRAPGVGIVAVDNSSAMIERFRKTLDGLPQAGPEVTLVRGDIREQDISRASMVVMNYTLQFLPVAERAAMLERIAAGTVDGGVLVLSEKVIDDDPEIEALLVDLHHDFKRRNAYSDLEISRKRTALENVLVPEPVSEHLARLDSAGYRHAGVWLRRFNFVSIVAVK